MKNKELKKKALESLKGNWGKVLIITIITAIVLVAYSGVSNFLSESESLNVKMLLLEILLLIVSVPVSYANVLFLNKIKNGDNPGVLEYFKDIVLNFGRSWGVSINVLFKMIGWIFLTIIVVALMEICGMSLSLSGIGIVGINLGFLIMYVSAIIFMLVFIAQAIYYAVSNIISINNTTLKGKEAVEKSRELMKKHRAQYAEMLFSFLGWALIIYAISCIFDLLDFNYATLLSEALMIIFLAPYVNMTVLNFYDKLIEDKKIEK